MICDVIDAGNNKTGVETIVGSGEQTILSAHNCNNYQHQLMRLILTDRANSEDRESGPMQ
jgi:hypothetical protein